MVSQDHPWALKLTLECLILEQWEEGVITTPPRSSTTTRSLFKTTMPSPKQHLALINRNLHVTGPHRWQPIFRARRHILISKVPKSTLITSIKLNTIIKMTKLAAQTSYRTDQFNTSSSSSRSPRLPKSPFRADKIDTRSGWRTSNQVFGGKCHRCHSSPKETRSRICQNTQLSAMPKSLLRIHHIPARMTQKELVNRPCMRVRLRIWRVIRGLKQPPCLSKSPQ